MTGARVLVVDDTAALVENLAEILEAEGYQVKTAPSAARALDAARSGFEVALVDLRLPDGSGTSLVSRLKELSPEGEVVLLTGYATLETAIAAVRSGAFAYLIKPCATAELLLTIEQALRQVGLHAEKRELSRRALVAEKLAAVGTMTAGLSHEIRNPLNAAGLQLAVLERRLRRLPEEDQPLLLEPVGLVRDEIRRLTRLLEEFLTFARPRELTLLPTVLATIVEAVVALFSKDAERRQISLEVKFEPALPKIAGDRERLQQALMNLILNALDATPSGGVVRVSATASGSDVLLAVDDSGPGVPADVRDRVFEPFFTTKAAGTGLGLPMVHAIAAQHGGNATLGTSPLGGARFVLRLPKAN